MSVHSATKYATDEKTYSSREQECFYRLFRVVADKLPPRSAAVNGDTYGQLAYLDDVFEDSGNDTGGTVLHKIG